MAESEQSADRLGQLQAALEALTSQCDGALALTSAVLPDDPEMQRCLRLLTEARGIVQEASRRRAPRAARPAERPTAEPTSASVADYYAAEMAGLDPQEREEREMARLRAQFAAGAAEDEEHLDWSEAVGGGSDDEGELGVGNDDDEAAAAAAAARVLDAVRGSEEPGQAGGSVSEPTWAELEGYVPPGSEGFNASLLRQNLNGGGVQSELGSKFHW